MTYKQIEAARELRLWIGQIVVPAVAIAAAIPEIREPVVAKFKEVTRKITKKKEKVVKFDKEGKPIAGRYPWGN